MTKYDRFNPFHASLKKRWCFNSDNGRGIYGMILNVSGSSIKYNIGESVGIIPTNNPKLVQQTIKAINASENEIINHAKFGEISLRQILTKYLSITKLNKKLIRELAHRQTNQTKKEQLTKLLENKKNLENYLSMHFLWDMLLENEEVKFTPQEICSYLLPILPRLYSIASSMNVVGDEMHLIVTKVEYMTGTILRQGVCTDYLCNRVPLNEPIIPIYVPSVHFNFTLPKDNTTPIIMVGPGAGIAPFRAFLQERITTNAPGENWLFFGARHQKSEFFYQDDLIKWEEMGKLKLSLAFSRDQSHSIYVQHRMLENAKELWDWLKKGANFYVCGNASRMAKDVENALSQIIREQGQMSAEDADKYIHDMRKNKRYMRDIY